MPVRLVMDVLDAVEFDRRPVGEALNLVLTRQSIHEGLAAFIKHAAHRYLSIREAEPSMLPVARWWVVQHIDQGVRELWAWGRRYRSADGAMRELRLIRIANMLERRRSEAEVAVAAYTAAYGRPASWPDEWDKKFSVRAREEVSRVVVAEIDLTEGLRNVLFDGSVEDAAALYEKDGRRAAIQVLNGQKRRPGGDCLKCRLVLACEEVARAPGLLGLRAHRRATLRQVSISDLRYYANCPAQHHLQTLHLPKANEYSTPARIGQAVHRYLETLHAIANGPCQPSDMPAETSWHDRQWGLDADAAEVGLRMLAHHPSVCPLQEHASDLRIEETFVFHDTAAQALVIAKPDLVYRDDDVWVWRETKTTRRRPSGDVVAEFPQVALATVVLGRGLLGGPVEGSRVELEILRPTGADLILFDPSDPQQLDEAYSVLRKMAQPWREDDAFAAVPGKNCRTCPVHKWCPSAAETDPPPSSQETASGADPEQPA
ncbi:PD-(D/E)XK nuclease family protein [Solwaraspora sp. WMMA2080]|uniref:PD-(D/E)XK nuclease family protein n=1 Tax=unclassified Solwaraspora TaxID=2627926 RepID=UPI00248B0ED4|nr:MULTISPECIES: PD-(D/E)XK nuclease family protein [unclassified Solwaraspora]WBB97746.1 PD-(D/E)XK nuclease family protein [Solwaraspora sp. WMMA2059]WBC18364.1 PD-(D/E)XK nuclease family protein [Solwaraspora sp. WMMA2080]